MSETKTLKQDQLRYARKRINGVLETKLREVERWRRDSAPAKMSREEKLEAIRQGKAGKLKIPDGTKWSVDVTECFPFPEEAKLAKEEERIDREAAKKAAALRQTAQDLLDELILGDAAEALQKIREFEAMEVPS